MLAVEGNRGASDHRALRVIGTTALKSGWKTSVKIFTSDKKKNWLAKSGSGFSCHLISTFAGCTAKQTTNALAQVFAFVNDLMNNTANSTTHAETNVLVLPSEDAVGQPFRAAEQEEFVGAATGISHSFVCVCAVINLAMQIY